MSEEPQAKESLGAKALLHPTPCLLVCAYSHEGRANMAAVAWGGVCNSRPVSVAVSLRSATFTHGCIQVRKAFTVAVPSVAQAAEADYVGMASGREVDKFARLGWTALRSELVDAPYPAECPLVLECELAAVHELGLHTQFVGEVKDVKVDAAALRDGKIDIARLQPMLYAPDERAYYAVGERVGDAFSIGNKFK